METYQNRMDTGRLKRAIEEQRRSGDYICKTCNANQGQRPDGVAPRSCTSCGGQQFNVHVAPAKRWPANDPSNMHRRHRAFIAHRQREAEAVSE